MENYRPHLFPRIEKIARFLGGFLVPFHEPADPYMSTHHTDELLLADPSPGTVYTYPEKRPAPDIAGRDL